MRLRKSIDADDMQKCSKGLTLKEKLMLSNWQSCESEERYTSINKLETIINNATEDDYIYIYRTFKVRKGRAIRKGMNKNSTTHVEGSGISYSISKTSAINVAWWLHKSTAEKFGISLNLRPQNLEPEMYFKLVKEYESLSR